MFFYFQPENAVVARVSPTNDYLALAFASGVIGILMDIKDETFERDVILYDTLAGDQVTDMAIGEEEDKLYIGTSQGKVSLFTFEVSRQGRKQFLSKLASLLADDSRSIRGLHIQDPRTRVPDRPDVGQGQLPRRLERDQDGHLRYRPKNVPRSREEAEAGQVRC